MNHRLTQRHSHPRPRERLQLSSLGDLQRHARIHDEALVSVFTDLGLALDTGT
jgi:hypothetical protein